MHFSPFILYVRKRQYSQIYIHFYALCLVNYQIICLIIQLKSDNLYIRILAKLEKIMFSYKEEECDRYAMRWGGCPFLFDKDMMFPVKEGIFEGKKAMIPNKCSDYLIWHYGDEWSYMPPHDKREGHVAVCVDDLPYQELREEYMPKINKERLRWDSVFRKFYNMRIAKKSHKVRQDGLAMKARAVALDLQRAIDESGLKISELVESRSFRKLSALFGSYYKNQLSADFIGREDYTNIYAFYHPILVEIPDDIFYAAMLTLFYTERVSKAYRMLQIRKQWDHLSPAMEGLKKEIELFRKAADHYEFHRMKEAEQIISDLLQKYPGHPGFMKFKCRFLMEDAGENRIEAERFLDKALKMFPEDGYFLKYKADILWMDGEMQKAAELYLQVKNKTTNGIVWMEMDRFFRGYKSEILKSCEELIANHNKKEALALMELWSRLIPEDDDIQGALYLAKTVCARTQSEIEKEIGEIRAVIGTQMITPVSVEKNPGKSRKQIKSDRTSDETSADDVNKKVSPILKGMMAVAEKLKKLKRRRIYRLKFQKNIRCTGKLLQEHGSGWGIPMSLQNCAPRSSVQVRRANWSGLQNRYETVSSAEKRKPALISWWVMSG